MDPSIYWNRARDEVPGLPEHAPDAWAFGATPEQADELLHLVLRGIKPGPRRRCGTMEQTATLCRRRAIRASSWMAAGSRAP